MQPGFELDNHVQCGSCCGLGLSEELGVSNGVEDVDRVVPADRAASIMSEEAS